MPVTQPTSPPNLPPAYPPTHSPTPPPRIHNKPVNPLWNWTAVESVPVEATAYLPSTSNVKIRLGAGEAGR